jgi:TPR repeat protein
METCYQRELVHAEAGKIWAHVEVGKRLRLGQGVPKDCEAAIQWLTKAAEQGSSDAMAELASMWLDGDDVPKSLDKAWKWALMAGRQGNAPGQSRCGLIEGQWGNVAAAWQWLTLSAAQGWADVQAKLGDWFYRGEGAPSPFKAYYWFKKAALQRSGIAQSRLSNLVVKLAQMIHGGNITIDGYCPLPESHFWAQKAFDELVAQGKPVSLEERERNNFAKVCAWCRDSPSDTVTVRKCVQCQAFGYCSKKCQLAHWKNGHKVDCNRVKELKQAFRN